jgi:transcriptional regulator with XRE-family HTH domain
MRAKPTSPPLTLDVAIEIWRRRSEGLAQHVLAAALGVNQGRISEVLTGKKFPEAKHLASGN